MTHHHANGWFRARVFPSVELVYFIPQEQQPVGGQRHAEGAAGAGRRGQRGSQPGYPQAHDRLDQGEGGAGAEGVGLEERGRGEGTEREGGALKKTKTKQEDVLKRRN